MKYAGAKTRIFKKMMPIILKGRGVDQPYVEPFLGGANSMQFVDGIRIGGEFNWYIASMWKELLNGWKPDVITKDEYKNIKLNKDEYHPSTVGLGGLELLVAILASGLVALLAKLTRKVVSEIIKQRHLKT